MRFPRLTTRRLMVLVAIAAAVLGVARLYRMRAEYDARAADFAKREAASRASLAGFDRMLGKGERLLWGMLDPKPVPDFELFRQRLRLERAVYVAQLEHYGGLRRKFERAARYPWLPVPPDPPAPE